jgi:2Fe-2S type ferredoxin
MPTVEYLSYEVVEENGWDVRDPENFEKADEMELNGETYGRFEVDEDEYILDAAEEAGIETFYECRMGTCATCAAVLVEGEVDMDVPPILSPDEEEKGFRLTCIGVPESDELKLVLGAKEHEDLDII